MSDEYDRYHELERSERRSWRPIALAGLIALALGLPFIVAVYYCFERFA